MTFGEVGDSPGQFSYPRCIDTQGRFVWVIDKLARVQKIDPSTGRCVGGWRMPDWQNGKPTGITVWTPPAGGATRIIVPDTHYHRVMIYDPDGMGAPDDLMESRGRLIASFGSYGEGEGQFIYPTDVAVLPTPDGAGMKRLYVLEYGGHDRISVFEPAAGGTPGDETRFVYRFSFGKFGSGLGVEFNRPQSMEIDPQRNELIVTDACNHRLGRFTLDGELIAWIGGGIGKGVGQMQYPYGLVLLGGRRAMVAEFGGNRVQVFDLDAGKSLGVYGQAGRSEGQLASPWGVAVWEKSVLVLDSGNNRVQGFSKPGGMWSAAGRGSGGPG
ncbi:hypothetical protein PHYC_02447 [Phycisphaerales bacterium]|nr:hypothetical protein PHYC_02447 [Phycisphaerales bacterium]